MPAIPSTLMPVFLAYEALGASDADHIEVLRGSLEEVLVKGEILTPQDLFAKARYLQHTGRIDPGQISMEALDTLVVGIGMLFPGALCKPVAVPAAA
ncbi:hypothetical protein GBZ48_21545 [Azospirillum melinis]|uniref:Uncharacterized protein n=1 Tax=Azospirillum melinis TaxID=328839 RepID=A0ABX2KMB0_9PROT|nr:hypothetical protein [Azospirillum melinis]MBP2309401.1 hypothetical protein [Azospirillum melinis]NUB01840.1 hypothetical protein [Azospirillum melinis]